LYTKSTHDSALNPRFFLSEDISEGVHKLLLPIQEALYTLPMQRYQDIHYLFALEFSEKKEDQIQGEINQNTINLNLQIICNRI
jgi:hypothetical protein